LLVVCCLRTASSDVVVLSNGNEIQGEVLKEDAEQVQVRFPGGTLVLKRKDVRSIQRQPRIEYLIEEGEKALLRCDYDEAVEAFDSAMREAASSERARLRAKEARQKYGDHLARLHRYEESLAYHHEALTLDPEDKTSTEAVQRIRAEQESALAEERAAVALVQAGRLQDGIEKLEKAYDSLPDRRDAIAPVLSRGLVQVANGLVLAAKWPQASETYDRALALRPECADDVRPGYVRAKLMEIQEYAGRGEFTAAGKLAAEGLEIDPANAALNYYQALGLESEGKTSEAAALYAALAGETPSPRLTDALPALRGRAEAALRELGQHLPDLQSPTAGEVLPGGFRRDETPHFTVHHRNTALSREVRFVAEKSYAEIFDLLACSVHWHNRCDVFVFPTRDEYLEAAGANAWSGGAHHLARRRGAFSEHRIFLYQGQPRLTDGVLRHEIAHALLLHRLNYPASLPLWASEGFAVYVEPEYLHSHFRRLLKHAKERERLIPLRDVLAASEYPDETLVDLFYAESFSLVEFLIRQKGIRGFIDLLRDLNDAEADWAMVLRRRFGFPSSLALENRWLQTL
jgi:tetratricopeptide (TPR) repeat protein